MPIPFLDMRGITAAMREDLIAAATRVIDSGWFVLGEEVAQFERDYATYCETQRCVGVGNGLEALTLALRALDIGPGDEVIVPANTYIATWLAVSHVGARPVPVEPDERTYNIDPTRIEAAITPRTRVILPVHLYGQPADLDPILDIARHHGLVVLEDGAQAQGARYQGRRLGAGQSLVAWSFYPGKNLGALGDGGGITCGNDVLADKVAALRNYGSKVKYHNEVIGYNSRLDEIHAAFLRVKLARLDADNARRRHIAARYTAGLDATGLTLPFVPNWADPVWHLYVVRHPDRPAFVERLSGEGIGTVIHYPIPPHLQPAYADMGYENGDFPISEAMHREVVSLPIGPTMSDEQVEGVIDAVNRLA
ncbi:DegT/DnrJ/EryC1/StrS aminotransferase family protein [Sphingomonas sp. TZW2008]|uniref:DegT/DnrJ/EryC1/StrS family aminotransferase n=1 Tax=Sphingomonas sp. TZW2008 TaxID=1917973 RepID=UPI000A26D156|nr:DegT/DnrJ/EryC1/StrS family aminotransferase [Sphingomonas sp. TZW2008]